MIRLRFKLYRSTICKTVEILHKHSHSSNLIKFCYIWQFYSKAVRFHFLLIFLWFRIMFVCGYVLFGDVVYYLRMSVKSHIRIQLRCCKMLFMHYLGSHVMLFMHYLGVSWNVVYALFGDVVNCCLCTICKLCEMLYICIIWIWGM